MRDLRVEASIGIHKRERHVRQTLSIDLDIGLPGTAVFSSDKVADTIDYEQVALRIRDLAKESAVPVLQAPALARALYAHAELDREIPAALFAAVAQVLAYVYQLRAALAGQVAMPNALPELDVPEELDPHHKPVPDMDIDD